MRTLVLLENLFQLCKTARAEIAVNGIEAGPRVPVVGVVVRHSACNDDATKQTTQNDREGGGSS